MKRFARALQRPGLRRAVFAAYFVFTCGYLFWRVAFTWNGEHPVYSGLFLVAEIACILSAFLFYVLVLERRERAPVAPEAGLSVDVLIATYNEDAALLRRTAVAARDMSYPHRTFLCDDGRRSEVSALAREIGIGYITRPSNEHFKAGNLNNALARTDGDFVMVLDADHVPRAHFLDAVLGHFRDPRTALVQTPQVYYNIDSFQHSVSAPRRRFWHEAAVFHHAMQPGADRFNAAFFIGTGAVLRRSALEKIGGFATGSITEDIHTSMRLHAAGFRSAYVDEALGFLLACDTPFAYARQRLRWAQGSMQVLRRENPLFKKGLTILQKLGYANSLGGYLLAYQHLLFYLAPGIYLLTGVSPIAASSGFGFYFFCAHIVVDILVYKLLGAPHARLFLGECYKVLNAPIFIRASLRLVKPEGLAFHVTPKGAHEALPYSLIVPSALLAAFNLTAVSVGILHIVFRDGRIEALLLTTYFAGYFALVSVLALWHVFSRRAAREQFAFPLLAEAVLRDGAGRTVRGQCRRLSPESAYVVSELDPPVGERVMIAIRGIGVSREIAGEVTGVHPNPDSRRPGHGIAKIRLLDATDEEKDAIDRFLLERALPAFLSGFKDGPRMGPAVDAAHGLDIIRGYVPIHSDMI